MSKKKLNNKGFAVSAMLYTLLTAFLLFLGASLAQFSSSAKILSSANNDLTDGFAYNISVYYNVNGGQLTSPKYELINGKDGKFLIDGKVFEKFNELRKDPWTLFATTNFSYVNKYSYPVVGMPYVPLDNDFVVNKAGLTKKGYRFIGWGKPTLRWLYIEKKANGDEITSGVKSDYGKTINYANLLNYASGREDSGYTPKTKTDDGKKLTVNALQIIYNAKWDVDVFVYYIYPENASGSALSDVKEDPDTHAKYKYVKSQNGSLAYDNILLSNIGNSYSLKNHSDLGVSNCHNLNQKVNFYDGSKDNGEEGVTINNNNIEETKLNGYHNGKGNNSSTIQIIVDRRNSTCS